MGKRTTFTSVITGDIVGSRKAIQSQWLPKLKKTLSHQGKSPEVWEIYRGDSFQLEVKDPLLAFRTTLRIKATIKTVKNLDVRMGIGIGEKRTAGSKIAESEGEAFLRSGETFESLRQKKQHLAVGTPWPEFDREMNVCFRLASIPMDEWTQNSAELVLLLLRDPNLTQEALAKKLRVTQPSVSERHSRSHYDDILDLEALYQEKIKKLISG